MVKRKLGTKRTFGDISAISVDYMLEIARGNVEGQALTAKVGQKDDINTTFEDIWFGGGNLTYPVAAESWEIVSDNANDTSAGSGARTITVTSLDTSYNAQADVTVTLNGTTPVALTGTFFRMQGMFIATAGGLDQASVATGKITLRVASAGATRGVIPAGSTGDFGSHFTVPLGKTAIFIQSDLFAPKNEDMSVRTRFSIGASNVFLIGGTADIYQSSVLFPFQVPLLLPEKSEFVFQAKTTNLTDITGTTVAEFVVFDDN